MNRALVLVVLAACAHVPQASVDMVKLDDCTRAIHGLEQRYEQRSEPVEPHIGMYRASLLRPQRFNKTLLGNSGMNLNNPATSLGAGATGSDLTLSGTLWAQGNVYALKLGDATTSVRYVCLNPNSCTMSLNINPATGGVSLTASTWDFQSSSVSGTGAWSTTNTFTALSLASSGTNSFSGATPLNLTHISPTLYASQATGPFQFSTNISAGNAGATTATSAFTFYPQNALDATDWVFNISTAVNAATLFNVAYSGAVTLTGNATNSGAYISSNSNSIAFQASGAGGKFTFANMFTQNTAPTISSGFGSSPSIVSSNGSLSFQINVGTGGVATTGVIGLPTAANGWVCTCEDVTTQNTTVARTRQTGLGTTTTCPIGDFTSADVAGAWVASDKLTCIAVAY